MPSSRFVRSGGIFLGVVLAASGCISNTSGELDTFAGEWCTLRGLGADALPVPGVAYVGMTLFEQTGMEVTGSGSTSRPASDTLFPARYFGVISGGVAEITVTDLDELTENPGPQFVMALRGDGARDLVGTMSGDPDFNGPIHLVRLGPRCFLE